MKWNFRKGVGTHTADILVYLSAIILVGIVIYCTSIVHQKLFTTSDTPDSTTTVQQDK